MKKNKITDYNVTFVEDFSEGLAVFRINDIRLGQKSGFCNKKFQVEIPPIWDKAYFFCNGLAAVRSEGKVGYINKKGRLKIDCKFWDAGMFKNGLAYASVGKGNSYGYINKKGIFKIQPIYQLAFDFSCGIAIIVLDNCFFAINTRGKIISEKLANYTML